VRLTGLVEAAFLNILLGVVLFDPGEQGLGVTGDGIAKARLLLEWERGAEELDARGEQELERGVGHAAQHRAEVAALGRGGGHIKPMRRGGIGHTREAEPVDQRGVLDEVGAQVGHVALAFVQLNEIGGGEGGTRVRVGAGPSAVGRAFGEVGPGERTKQIAILLDDWVGCDPGGQRRVGMRQRAGGVGQSGRTRRPAEEGRAQPVERSSEIG